MIEIKPVKRPQLLIDVVEFLGQLKRAVPGGSNCVDSADSAKHGIGERHPQHHLLPPIGCRHPVQRRERPLDPVPALAHQRELHPERHRGNRQRNADDGIAVGRDSPVQCRANVVDVPRVYREPLGRQPPLGFRLRLGEQVAEVLCVPA